MSDMEQRDPLAQLPSFTTERLLLRAMVIEDAEPLHSLKTSREATRLYGEAPYVDVAQTRSWVQECIDGREAGEVLVWTIVLRATGTPIGMVCFWHIDHDHHHAEIGYEVTSKYWRQGLMSEALPPMIDHGFNAMGLHRIEATPLSINIGSQRLLERNGFRKEGILRQRLLFESEYLDEMYYGLTRDEWVSSKSR